MLGRAKNGPRHSPEGDFKGVRPSGPLLNFIERNVLYIILPCGELYITLSNPETLGRGPDTIKT